MDTAQAWREHCQQGFDCVRHPQPPSKAYLISLPIDVPKRVHTLRLLAELGLDVEVIDGIKSVQVCSWSYPGLAGVLSGSLAPQSGHFCQSLKVYNRSRHSVSSGWVSGAGWLPGDVQ